MYLWDVKFQTPNGHVILDFRAGRGAAGGLLWSSGKAFGEKGSGTEPLKVEEKWPDEEGPKVLTSPGNCRLVWEDRWVAVEGTLGGDLWIDLLTWSGGRRWETNQRLRCASSLGFKLSSFWFQEHFFFLCQAQVMSSSIYSCTASSELEAWVTS